jgi:hypothetical protein
MKTVMILLFTIMLSGCVHAPKNVALEGVRIQGIDIALQNPQKIRTFDGCAANAYVLRDGQTFIEYVNLKSYCVWNGLGSSFFRNLLNEKYDLEVVQSFRVGAFSIVHYKNKNEYFYFLSTVSGNANYFIIDYSGEIASKISDNAQVIAQNKRVKALFDKSLVKNNILGNYFSNESRERKIILP